VIGELVGQLVRGVQRIVLDGDRAEAQHGVERDHVLRAVRQDQRHPVAGAHPDRPQRLGGPGHLVAELGVGGGGTEEVERDPVRKPGHRAVQVRGQRLSRLGDVRRDPLRIGGQPGPVVRHASLPGRTDARHSGHYPALRRGLC
jgi:hypothetical protein